MTETRNASPQILQRIADALGTDVTAFANERARETALHDTLELLTAFETVVDLRDRRACLDFVRSVAAHQSEA